MSSQIQFIIDDKFAVTWLAHGESLSKIKNFAYQISQYTNAEIRRVWATKGDGVTIPQKSGNMMSLHHCAHIFVRRVADSKLYAVKILSPNYDLVFNEDQEVKPEVGENVASYYSSLAGETFEFSEGALVGSNVF